MLPYLALSFLVALWFRSTAAGITAGLVVFLLEGLLVQLLATVGGPLAHVPDALLSRNTSAITALNSAGTGSSSLPSDLPNVWQATGVLAAYIVAFLALAYWRFSNRDVTSG
jgi:ABC-type transport system involved in multi-copper enzyme maturation permease subunit